MSNARLYLLIKFDKISNLNYSNHIMNKQSSYKMTNLLDPHSTAADGFVVRMEAVA